MTIVVDASAIIALVVADERQGPARALVESWLDAGEGLHAPAVLPYEVANVLARLVSAGELRLDDVGEVWEDIAALGLVLDPFDLVGDGPEVAAITARLRRRHATDSTHVRLARRLGTAVWTLDRASARNAAAVGLPVRLVP